MRADRADVEDDRIQNGSIICLACNHEYPIIKHIPRFVDQNNYCESFGYQWNRHRRIQLDTYNGYRFSHERVFEETKWPVDLKDQFVLEAGSGAGRFTQVLLGTRANVFSFDYSAAVNANLENNGELQNLNLFQADLHQLPLQHGLFDKIICFGVLQHTPKPEKAFYSLIPFLKSGGEIVIDVYKKTFFSMMQWKYILRPALKRLENEILYHYVRKAVPLLLPFSVMLRKTCGPIGNRILPIANYSELGIPFDMNKELSILDTFDMYSPKFDQPQTLYKVRKWFHKAGLQSIDVRYGRNGIVGKGIKI